MSPLPLRSDLTAIPAYVAGRPPRPRNGQSYKLSSNESPFPPDPSILKAIGDAATSANRYPNPVGAALVARLAEKWSVPAERMVVGGGSLSLLQLIVLAVADPGDAVVFGWRSYEAYPIVVPASHAAPVAVPLAGQSLDLPAMAAAVRRTHARAVIVCGPNNPTATAVGATEVDQFIEEIPEDCLIVLDEAYAEFNDDPNRPDGFALARRHPNVAVLRTLSKAYGLAGMRIGYCAAPTAVADAVRRIALPFTLSSVAEAAALAALDLGPAIAHRVGEITRQREKFAAALGEIGVETTVSRANFVWLPLGAEATDLDAALGDAGISVRTFPGDGVRITIGEPVAMTAALDAIRAWRMG